MIHSLVLFPGRVAALIGGRAERSDSCWVGVEVGVPPLTGDLIDALDGRSPSPHRVHGELHDGQATLQLRHVIRPEDVSVSFLREIIADLQASASELYNDIGGRLSRPLAIDPSDSTPSVHEQISAQFTTEWKRILRHAGHRPELSAGAAGWAGYDPATGCEVLAVSRDGWYQSSATPWPTPGFITLHECATRLGSVEAPEFAALRESAGMVQACGAIGGMTYVMEDDADLERAFALIVGNATRPSVFDVVGRYFWAARKMDGLLRAEPSSGPRRLRPLLVQASGAEGRIRIYTRRPSGRMVMDASISHAATAFLRQPDSREAAGRLSFELDEWYTRALERALGGGVS